MYVCNVFGYPEIRVPVGLVQNEPEQVEPGEQGGRQVDVLGETLPGVVAAVLGVGSSQDGDSGVETCQDAGLGDTDGLLLHNL